MSKKHKITEKTSKKCAAEDLFTSASDDVIPGNEEPNGNGCRYSLLVYM